jgi:hypothetical protein
MEHAMRFFLALGLFMAMCASADAATAHQSRSRHHVSVRHAYDMVPPGFANRPNQSFDPRFPPVLEDQTPSYDDPSKFGGG